MRTAIMSLRDLLAEPHAGVEALGDDVGQAESTLDLDADVGIVGQQPSPAPATGSVPRGMLAGGDADRAGRLVAQLAERGERLLDLLEPRRHACASRRSPASVGATLRVVRVSSRTPSRASRPRSPG